VDELRHCLYFKFVWTAYAIVLNVCKLEFLTAACNFDTMFVNMRDP